VRRWLRSRTTDGTSHCSDWAEARHKTQLRGKTTGFRTAISEVMGIERGKTQLCFGGHRLQPANHALLKRM
jgi:hypothetical protein